MDELPEDPAITTEEHGTPSQIAKLYAAFALAQGEFLPIVKNRSVSIDIKDKATGAKRGSYNFRYADLEEITAKTRPALTKHGLATMQPISVSSTGSGTSIFTKLTHKDGGCITSECPLPAHNEKREIKDYGALVSYLRRYAKTAILDVAADDDLDESGQQDEGDDPVSQAPRQPQPRKPRQSSSKDSPTSVSQAPAGGEPLTAGMVKTIRAQLTARGKEEADLLQHLEVGSLENLGRDRVNDALDWVKA